MGDWWRRREFCVAGPDEQGLLGRSSVIDRPSEAVVPAFSFNRLLRSPQPASYVSWLTSSAELYKSQCDRLDGNLLSLIRTPIQSEKILEKEKEKERDKKNDKQHKDRFTVNLISIYLSLSFSI